MPIYTEMALKNADGTTYTLSKPNPIMLNQTLWRDKCILHNIVGRKIMIDDVVVSVPVPKPTEKPAEPQVVEKLEEPTPDPNVTQIWCLPASYKEVVDSLYGEKFQRLVYGKKFLFDAIIIESEDLYLTLWTDTRAVTAGSVIYPRNQDKRWWRVQNVKEENGYLIYAMVTDYQPDFSD
jgi:hypothetical protein